MTHALDHRDRLEIHELLVRYATGIDRRDWDQFRTCFTTDCVADYTDIGLWHGVDEITAFMDETHAGVGHTLHRITNQAVAAGPDANTATARSYVDAIVMLADNQTGVRAVGFYDDDLVRDDLGWQIARRTFTPVVYEGVGAP